MKLSPILCLLALPVVAACSGLPEMPKVPEVPSVPSAPGLPGASDPASSTSTTSAPAPKAAEPASAPVPTTVEIHSDCAKTTPVFYGEKPKFGSGTKSSIGSNTTTTAPRKADGSLTVWIIDDKENGVASVQVNASTKRVEIDKSCKQITAR
ncbi:MAG: hypothetical protein KF819_36640 [Labilithrix sp.]|nr:hypothetical protein [Labilithrix sp.]